MIIDNLLVIIENLPLIIKIYHHKKIKNHKYISMKKSKLRKIVYPVLVAFVALNAYIAVPLPASAAGPNLIANPSVETADAGNPALPANWATDETGTHSAVFSYPVAGQDGAAAVKVQVTQRTSGLATWYFDYVPVTPGKTYVFSDYYQSNVKSVVRAHFLLSNNRIQKRRYRAPRQRLPD